MKKIISALMAVIMTFGITTTAFAAENSMIGTYEASDGSKITVMAGSNLFAGTSPDDELGDYNLSVQGKVYEDVGFGGALQLGYDSDSDTLKDLISTDSLIKFSSQQLYHSFINADGAIAIGPIHSESDDEKILLLDDNHNFYWVKCKSENSNTRYYEVLQTYKKVSTSASTPVVVSTPSSSTTTFKTDTGSKLTIDYGKAYQFKITILNGKKPTFVVPGKAFQVTANGSKGKDYFFKIKAVGKDGESAGVYINGQKTPSTVITVNNKVKIDTGAKLIVRSGEVYQFKITANAKPTFVSGNNSVFRLFYNVQKGNDYFYKATAVGKKGQDAGFYLNGSKTPCTVGMVG